MLQIQFAKCFSARLIAAGIASSTLLSACSGPEQIAPPPMEPIKPTGAGKHFKIGFANLTEDLPYAVRVREGIEDAARKAGNIELISVDNQLDGATALANADSLITQKVDGVIEYQTDAKFAPAIMAKFKANKIPVIAVDIPMPGAPFFGVNNPVAGNMSGKGLGEWVKKNWSGKVDALVMLELPQSGPIPAARMKGLRDGLESVIGKIPESKVKHLDSKNTLEEAYRLMVDTLTTLPNAKHIAVVCINDDTATGVIKAAETKKRRTDIAVASVDGSELGRRQLRRADSPQVGTTASFPEKYGEKLVPALIKAMSGEKLPDSFYTNHVLLTKKNVNELYPDDSK